MTVIRVFDLETTGIDPKDHTDNRVERVGAYLVNPGRAIPPEASAVHHLIDGDIAGAQPFDQVWPAFLPNAPIVYAAHNCEFEQAYIPTPAGTQWICTHKCALRVWADAPGHSNQVFIELANGGLLDWFRVISLGDLIASPVKLGGGFKLFKSLGAAIEDLAVAAIVYDEAMRQGAGSVSSGE